jgi:hypothetical protein
MVVPELPLDVLYVVACHLAGTHAFGSLANLHLANHDVAETVLPVLYETLLMDNEENLPFVEDESTLLEAFSIHKVSTTA